MAFLLKKPQGNSKGIIIFTHKERDQISNRVPGLLRVIEELKKSYVLGMHWGFLSENISDVSFIDFYMAGKGTLKVSDNSIMPRIYMSSRNFTPAFFAPNNSTAKYWDILSIARTAKFKRLDQFLEVMRKVFDQRPATRVLLICTEPEKSSPRNSYTDLMSDYKKLFSEDERKRFTILLLSTKEGMFPLSQETMVHFYNSSRVFTLFSDYEGESRVISEALLTGLPVVVKKKLEGGGRDYLDDSNSAQFESLSEAAGQFVNLLDNELSFDRELMARKLSEVYSVETFEDELKRIFRELNVPFNGEWDKVNLTMKLPSHFPVLPRYLTNGETDDLISPKAALLLLSEWAGLEKPGIIKLVLVGLYGIAKTAERLFFKIRNKILARKSFSLSKH